jgi:hypothetical protein
VYVVKYYSIGALHTKKLDLFYIWRLYRRIWISGANIHIYDITQSKYLPTITVNGQSLPLIQLNCTFTNGKTSKNFNKQPHHQNSHFEKNVKDRCRSLKPIGWRHMTSHTTTAYDSQNALRTWVLSVSRFVFLKII